MQQVTMQHCVLADARLAGADLRFSYVYPNNFRRVDLSFAQIAGMKSMESDFDGATMTGIIASDETYLGAASFRGANLSMAELAGAQLRYADLRGACLAGADLRGADLEYADLRGADLSGARLAGANLEAARLDGRDLGLADWPEVS